MIIVPGVDHAWADGHEQDPLFGVLRVELGHRHVHGGLTDAVWCSDIESVLAD